MAAYEKIALPGGRPLTATGYRGGDVLMPKLWVGYDHPSIAGHHPWIGMDRQGWYWVAEPGSNEYGPKVGPFETLDAAAAHYNLTYPEP